MNVKLYDDHYPYRQASKLVMPVVNAILQIIADRNAKLPELDVPKLSDVCSAVAAQPNAAIRYINDDAVNMSFDEKVERLVWLAFQFGLCQGHAMCAEEFGPDSVYDQVIDKFLNTPIEQLKPHKLPSHEELIKRTRMQ